MIGRLLRDECGAVAVEFALCAALILPPVAAGGYVVGPALLSYSQSVEARIVEAREEADRLEALIAELRAMQGGEP